MIFIFIGCGIIGIFTLENADNNECFALILDGSIDIDAADDDEDGCGTVAAGIGGGGACVK